MRLGEECGQLQIRFGKTGDFHLVLQQAELQRLIAVNRDDETFPLTFLGENMMTPGDALEPPSVALKDADKILAGNLFHTVSSSTLSLALVAVTSSSTDSHS